MNYYKRIKDCREDNDLIQQDVADYLGISRGNYAMYECGSNIIPLFLLDKLSIKYQVSIGYLVGTSKRKNNSTEIKPMNFKVMCKKLKEERLKLNFTQKQIAENLGITQSHYASYETGKNVIPITRLIELSKFYKNLINKI